MENSNFVSQRGFYYDLEKSPYVWRSPYGDFYKLPSKKRLDMMEKRSADELRRFTKWLYRNNLKDVLPDHMIDDIRRYIIEAVYQQIVE